MNYFYYHYATSQVCCVKEDQSTYQDYINIYRFLDHKCLENGSTYNGRKLAFQYKMKTKKFTPIIVSFKPLEIYFPSDAFDDPDCIWINYGMIKDITYEKKRCTIFFKDHTSLVCKHPQRIKNQMHLIFRYLQINGIHHYIQNSLENN